MELFTTPLLSKTTIDMYTTRIHKWITLVPQQSIEFIILFPKLALQRLITHLTEREALESRAICTLPNVRNYITSIIALLRYSPHIAPQLSHRLESHSTWVSLRNHITQPVYDRQIQEKPTRLQELRGGSTLSFADLLIARDAPEIPMSHRLLLAMYTYLYPVRADYYALQIITDLSEPTFPNYLRVSSDSSELMIRDFKTAKFFPPIHYPSVPLPLHHLIQSSLLQEPREFLFECREGVPFTRLRFSQWASSVFASCLRVPLNITMIRHLFISSLSMDTALDELQRIGRLMGHSISRQRLYKWRAHQDGDNGGEIEAVTMDTLLDS
jgi:hypothetical protein